VSDFSEGWMRFWSIFNEPRVAIAFGFFTGMLVCNVLASIASVLTRAAWNWLR
jgi:hypothetical protein